MRQISKELAMYILDANDESELYCVVRDKDNHPVASDIRIMSGLVRVEIRLASNKEFVKNHDKVWEYYMHITCFPITEHSLIMAFARPEDRDKALAVAFENDRSGFEAMNKFIETIESRKQ